VSITTRATPADSPPLRGRKATARYDRAVIAEGEPAPDFELTSDAGERVRLSDLRGRPVVLYFYPKDDTPGCTKQACGLRDVYSDFRARGAQVFGISSDDEASHAAFRAKYSLPFTLLADPERVAGEAYGVTRPDSPYFERSTFIVDADGNVARIMRKVDPTEHADLVLSALPE
jgi:peroxiredoxin Q/BCP